MFLVDSRASMHILSKRGSSPAEMDTSRRSRTPVTVVTADGEIQTTEEAQVYVHDLGLFVTVQILEETPAVLSLGKFLERARISVDQRSRTTVDQKWENYLQN